jgi:uncharacterized damage-inducible protein DinB
MSDVNQITLYEPHMATGDEKDLLRTHLRLVQQALLWKLEGLSDEDLRRPMTKTSSNLIGIVKHLTGVTYGYLVSAFGRERETFPWEFDEELFFSADMWATPEESVEEIIAAYRRACDAAAETIDELDLDATGTHHTGLTVSLRWMIFNVLMDTTRHTGHADVVREMIDGSIGMGPIFTSSPPADDEEFWRMYRARMTGEIDRETWMAWNRSRPDYDPAAWENFIRRAHSSQASEL